VAYANSVAANARAGAVSDVDSQFVYYCPDGLNGYCKLPNGLLLQWGWVTYSSVPTAIGGNIDIGVGFPTTFPNCVFSISAAGVNDGPTEGSEMNIGLNWLRNNGSASFHITRVTGTDTGGHENGALTYFAIGI
jgi:hypothetical protein